MTAARRKKTNKNARIKTLSSTVKFNHLANLSKPIPITGSDIAKITETYNLHLTETSLMLGLNTSSLYEKKKKDETQPANISILMRIYAALPEYIPSHKPPAIEKLILKIQEIDPEFDRSWIGILHGLEKNSSFRLRREGIDHGSQTTKILSNLIYKVICDNPENWFLIREIVEVESEARKIVPAQRVWTEGGWNRNIDCPSSKKKRPKLKEGEEVVLNSELVNES